MESALFEDTTHQPTTTMHSNHFPSSFGSFSSSNQTIFANNINNESINNNHNLSKDQLLNDEIISYSLRMFETMKNPQNQQQQLHHAQNPNNNVRTPFALNYNDIANSSSGHRHARLPSGNNSGNSLTASVLKKAAGMNYNHAIIQNNPNPGWSDEEEEIYDFEGTPIT